ncbi:MAG: flagellar protein export ATPase FliI [Peptococcaceae bacterium]|nr:flagellar protein export ATPase FliI [Peptococcaceae bacterium]
MITLESIPIDLAAWRSRLNEARLYKLTGRVTRVIGLTVEVQGINARIGEVCEITVPGEPEPVRAEVVGFRDGSTLLMPLGELRGIYQGCSVTPSGKSLSVKVGEKLLGRVLNGLGEPMDNLGPLQGGFVSYPVDSRPPNPLMRRRITEVLSTGVRAVDALLTCGRGQRIGIFAGSGVGKSTLLGMISRYSNADVNVIALIGERGREVLDFIETDLGQEGLARSVVVVATSEQPALVRLKGAFVASAIAEYFRDQGKDVMLMMDSVTRFAMAQREVGLAIGEPPATKGYTPSVFALLPRLLERPGMSRTGSITAFFTVLVDGDDLNEPIADAVRGILDGHIVLSRALAASNHYPAIDVLGSVSRLMPDITSEIHRIQAGRLRDLLAAYKQAEDLINIGAYVAGSNPRIDEAIASYQGIVSFLRQDLHEQTRYSDTLEMLKAIVDKGVKDHAQVQVSPGAGAGAAQGQGGRGGAGSGPGPQ